MELCHKNDLATLRDSGSLSTEICNVTLTHPKVSVPSFFSTPYPVTHLFIQEIIYWAKLLGIGQRIKSTTSYYDTHFWKVEEHGGGEKEVGKRESSDI